ncbi:MAG TPA: putative hydro-lyase [Stellaceae bacterium]|nr:putative hydro-lyase [Stellaceae bacterium]
MLAEDITAMGEAAAQQAAAREARLRIRRGAHTGQTAGLAPGMVQGNVAILPADWADDFLHFCRQNPKPCPILAVGRRGDPALPALGQGIDIRSDVPRYRVFRDGVESATPADIAEYWRDDLVAVVLGCSFSFEWALMAAGLRLKHVEAGSTVPMYRTTIDCAPSDRFRGKMVVSMRPFRPAEAIRAIEITARFPTVHGAPVHIGLPHMIGIADLGRPDFGDPVALGANELPLFWACGVTPQVAIEEAKPPLFISHFPGCMLITDLANATLAAR